VKLKTSSRISLVTVVSLTLLTGSIGGFAALHARTIATDSIDATLGSVIGSAIQNPKQPIGASLFAIEQDNLAVTLSLLTHDRAETIINESNLLYLRPPSQLDINRAVFHPVTVEAVEPYRLAVAPIEGGDFILAAMSLKSVEDTFRADITTLALVILILDALTLLILLLYFRRLNRREESLSLERMQEFLGDASHELRTPLTVIKGYVEMLSKNQLVDESDKSRAFDRVGSEIKRMENLIQDLLLLAELGESGSREIEVIDLSELVEAYATDFKTLNPDRRVELSIEPSIDLDGSRDYLARFMQNALTNISRHTPSDADVAVRLSKNGKSIELIVEDAGPGLPEAAYAEHIRSLNRFDKSRSRENGGSGLGMSIMSAVISKLGGTFSLRKSKLGGLAIAVELPLHKD
jgi:signal transduction histidine kinase